MKKEYDVLSRRGFVKTTGTIGLASILASCAPSGATEGDQETVELTHFIWVGGGQGIVPREVKAEYERDHPWVAIELYEGTNSSTYPKMIAQREVDPNDPLINFGFFNSSFMARGDLEDMWLPLDIEKVPNLDDVFEGFRRPNDVGVSWGFSGVGIMYNSDLVTEPPTSWMDIFDPKYKGKVMIHDYILSHNGFMGVAEAQGGDLEKAWKLFSDAAKDDQIHSFFEGNQMLKDAMVRGEVLIAPHFTNFAINWGPKNEGGPFGYVIPEEGMIAFPFGYQVVKGSTQAQIDVASEIINMYLSPEVNSRYCNLTGAIPVTKYAKLDKDLALEAAFQKDAIENAIQLDFHWLAENDAEFKERWDREVKANL